MVASMNHAVWVEWMTSLMGGVSQQSFAATFPPDRFYCLLDELPLHLLSRNVRREWQSEEKTAGVLRLSPGCVIAPGEQIPQEFEDRRELLSAMALQGTIAWVRDDVAGTSLPFWLGPETAAVLRGVPPGDAINEAIPSSMRQVLQRAGVLISEAGATGGAKREESTQRARAMFRERGYAPVVGLIHPFHVAALRRYFRQRIRTGGIHLGDNQSARRYVAHNEPVARFFHHYIANVFGKIVGEPIKPSYVYLASYMSGAELKKHTDREQCEFSITFCLDFSPEPAMATPWPIQLDTPSGRVTVYQAIGDGLAYRGTKLPHYREALGEGQTSTSIFFHYVPHDFIGPLN
jgi:hypothetical protein